MTKKIVLHSIDSPRRELEWKLYVAKKLLDNGFDSIIGSKTQIKLIHENSRNCIFLGRLDSVTARAKPDLDYLKSMQENNTKLFYLHDEGGFYFKPEYSDAVRKVYPENLLSSKVLEKMFFWGKKQAEVFENSNYQNKLEVTGSPRFDLLKSNFSYLDKDTIKRIQKKYGDFVLVCTRFGAVNRVPDEPTTLSKRSLDIRVEGGQDRTVALESMFKVWEKISYEFTFFIPAIAKLANAFPELNFVIRPHPAERMSFYSESFSHFDNVYIDKDGDVRPFIKASKLVIQSECTTGVEAEVARVPHINFRPAMIMKDFEGWDVAGVSDVGEIVSNFQGLHDAVKKYTEIKFKFEDSDSNISEYLISVKPDLRSTDLIVSKIKDFADVNEGVSMVNSLFSSKKITKYYIVMYLKEVFRTFRRKLFHGKMISKGDTKYFDYSPKYINDIWNRYGGDNKCLTIKSGIIFISKKK
jgi:surface carbohydrate biosynthesis protein